MSPTRGSVVRALSAASGYVVRAAVRDPDTPKAQALAALPDVKVFKVDADSAQTLAAAYAGADAVFACTQPDLRLGGAGTEIGHGTAMADAAKAAGVQLLVWSALPSIKEATGGELVVKHYDDKAVVTAYIKSLAVPATILYINSFMENYVNSPGYAVYDAAEDAIVLKYGGFITSKKLPFVRATKDVGEAVKIIVAHPAEFVGQNVRLGHVEQSIEEQAQIVQRLSGKRCQAVQGPQTPFPDLNNMYEFVNEYGDKHKDVPGATTLLDKYGFKPASFEGFVEEVLLPYLQL